MTRTYATQQKGNVTQREKESAQIPNFPQGKTRRNNKSRGCSDGRLQRIYKQRRQEVT